MQLNLNIAERKFPYSSEVYSTSFSPARIHSASDVDQRLPISAIHECILSGGWKFEPTGGRSWGMKENKREKLADSGIFADD